jgi:anti-sigma factor RsiW
MKKLPFTESDLHAYIDSLLPQDLRAEVEEYLASHPGEAQRLQAYQDQNRALKDLFNPLLDEPVPEKLLALAVAPATAISHGDFLPTAVNAQKYSFFSRWSLERIAAGLLIAVVSGVSGWLAHGQYQPLARSAQVVPFSRQAAVAHVVYSPDVKRPVEVHAEQEDQLVTWLSKRLGTPVRPPKLGALGYELIGGRLLPGNSGPVAQFMYHDASGQRLTLYVTAENTANQDTGFRFAQEGPVNVFYWIDGKFGYALSAGIDKGELSRVATAVYDQLEHK